MDFWDLTKLLVRRWMVALPMLLASGALTVLAFEHVKPNYVATAYVQPVPPVLAATAPGQPTPEQRNPWLGLGLETIGNAAIVMVMDQTVVDELEAAGYSDSFTIQMGSTSPLATFEVVGSSPQQARDTAEQLVARFSRSVSTLQAAYGVRPEESITARRLDLGTNVQRSDSNVKRALVAVAAAGLLLTVAVTVGVDGLLRRRARRRGAAKPVPSAPPVPQTPLAASVPPGGVPRTPSGGAHPAGELAPIPAGVAVEYRSAGQVMTAPVDARDWGGVERSMPEPAAEATTVLPPVSPAAEQWPRRPEERGERP